MQIMPVDLVALVSAVLGISIVLIPIIGLTARFALKPTVEALSRFFEHKGLDESVHLMERRMALLEQQIEGIEQGLRRIEEATEFHKALNEPESMPRIESGQTPPA